MVGNIFDNIKEPWWLGDRPIPGPCLLPVPLWLSGVCNDCMIIYHRQSNNHVLVFFLRQDCTPVHQALLMCTFLPQTNKHVAIFLRRGCTRAQPTLQLRWFWALEKFISLLAIFCENQLCTFMILANTIDTSCNCMLFRHNILSPGMSSEAWWPLRSWSTSPVGLSGPAWSLLGGRRRWVSTPSNWKISILRGRGYAVKQKQWIQSIRVKTTLSDWQWQE